MALMSNHIQHKITSCYYLSRCKFRAYPSCCDTLIWAKYSTSRLSTAQSSRYWHIEAETKWPPFPDDVFRCIFLNENIYISIKISLKFVRKCPINNVPALVLIMAWRWPLYEPMMVSVLAHICVTRPQWINISNTHTHSNRADIRPDSCFHVTLSIP